MKSQVEHIDIHNFHLISEMYTIYLPLYTARQVSNCIYALQQSKDSTCTCMPINKNNYDPYLEIVFRKF